MIYFAYATYNELQPFEDYTFSERVESLFLPGERTMATYRGNRGRIVAFTNIRIIATSLAGLRNQRVDYSSLPYKSVEAFSVESIGDLDMNSHLEIWFSEMHKTRFEFSGKANVKQICQAIGEVLL